MDYEAIKRLGLAYMNIDYEKSYEIYDSIHNNHIINIYLNVDKNICCPNCVSVDFISRCSIESTNRDIKTILRLSFGSINSQRIKIV